MPVYREFIIGKLGLLRNVDEGESRLRWIPIGNEDQVGCELGAVDELERDNFAEPGEDPSEGSLRGIPVELLR